MYSSMVAAPLAMLVGRTFVNDSNEVEADEKYSGDTVIARSIAVRQQSNGRDAHADLIAACRLQLKLV